jgi:multidrug efflux pump subunit AcrA (membrane-fusion protein)
VLLAETFFCASGCVRHRAEVASPPARVRSAPDVLETAAAPEPAGEFLGVVLAPSTVDLSSQLESRVVSVSARAGDRVTKDQVIAQLDTRAARKEVTMAHAAVLAATAELHRSTLELAQAHERARRRESTVELPSGSNVGTVSDEERASSEYDEKLARVKLDTARAALLDKRAHADELRQLAAEGAVRAPFDGIVAHRYADAGTILRKGSPIIRLIGSSGLKVRFAVPEEQLATVEAGSKVRVRVDRVALSGSVEKIAPEVDAAARVVFVDASLVVPPAETEHVRSGQIARVSVEESATP